MILSPTPLQSQAQARLREMPRIEVLGTLEGHSDRADFPLRVLDISLTGFGVESSKPFETGSVHRFRFTTIDGSAFALMANVMHCDRRPTRDGSDLYLTGFRFREDTDQHEAAGALVDKILGVISFDIQ